MTFEQFMLGLKECGWHPPPEGAGYTRNAIEIYSRMQNEDRQNERVNCRRQVEHFAQKYVSDHAFSDGAKAQGWAILQAAHDLSPGASTFKPAGGA